jgi:RHS repeat-associated protein
MRRTRGGSWRWLLGYVKSRATPLVATVSVCCMAVLGATSALALGRESAASSAIRSSAGSSTGGLSLLANPLVVAGSPTVGEQSYAQQQVWLTSPAAFIARWRSRIEYAHMGVVAAAKLVREAFPAVIDEPAGGPPMLPAGVRVVRYVSASAAQLLLPGGKHAVVESLKPFAQQIAPGRFIPLDLALVDDGAGFSPVRSDARVQIPKRLSAGVRLPRSGVSLIPVGPHGAPLSSSEGSVDGSVVFYGGVAAGRDVDMAVKPTMDGFEADAVLRSVDSPQQLSFLVGLPSGARLVAAKNASGAATVLDAGKVIAVVPAASVRDATGMLVPTSMSVSGDTLTLTVDHRAREYQYPIMVDPTVQEKEEDGGAGSLSTRDWAWATDNESGFGRTTNFEHNGNPFALGILSTGKERIEGQFANLHYPTQGESSIYHFVGGTTETNPSKGIVSALLVLNPAKKLESEEHVFPLTAEGETSLCTVEASQACPHGAEKATVTSENQANEVQFFVHATETSSLAFADGLWSSLVEIVQEKAPTATADTTDATLEGKPNAFYGSKWASTRGSPADSIVAVDAHDPGIGVEKEGLSSPNKSGWGFAPRQDVQNECAGVQCNECYEPACAGKGSGNGTPLTLSLAAEGGELPEGKDTVEVKVQDATGLSATASGEVKVDNTPPHELGLTGLPHVIGDGSYRLTASAKDGSGGESSGIASLQLLVDGRPTGSPAGSCSPGTCTATAEFTIAGQEFGAGPHTLTLVAKDNASNVAEESYPFTVHNATPVPIGPGSVNPESGEFTLNPTDVSISSPGSGLTFRRMYRSRHLTAGAGGPLGPQWSLIMGGQESITKLTNGNATLTAGYAESTFTSNGKGGFTSPRGDATLALSEVKNEKGELTEYLLKDATGGATTRFTSSSGPTASVWRPTKQEGPLASQTVQYTYTTVAGVTYPTQALAPVAEGVTCTKEPLPAGCRAMHFSYDAFTTAKGEAPSEWGEYSGRLQTVWREVYSTTSKSMVSTEQAGYLYDTQGRLRQVRSEHLGAFLKTTYGYDAEGHVVAVTPPGQQPWLLHYGTIPGDANTGRLLSVTRPAAGTAFGNGIAPSNSVLPTLSSTKPVVGTKISVSSNGTWSNTPLLYSYQWEDCNGSGAECSLIAGAVNQSYYPATSDEGHTLVAQVRATNSGGAVVAASAATSVVASGTPSNPLPEPPNPGTSSVWTVDYKVALLGLELPTMTSSEVEKWGQTDVPAEATAMFPPDQPEGWPAKGYKRASIEYFDSEGRTVNTVAPGAGVWTSEYNSDNDVVRTLSPDNRAAALKESCESKEKCKSAELAKLLDNESVYEETGSEPGSRLLETFGPQHTVKLAVGKKEANEEVLARNHMKYYYNEGAPSEGGPYNLVTKSTDSAETASKEEFDKRETTDSFSGQDGLGWTLREPTSVTTDPNGVKLTHTIVYEPSTGNVKETTAPAAESSQVSEYGQLPAAHSEQIAYGPDGNLWFTNYGTSKVGRVTPSGEIKEYGLPAGSSPYGITAGPDGNMWFADYATSEIGRVTPSGEVKEYPLPAGSSPYGIVAGPSNEKTLWFAETGTSKIGRMSTSGTELKEYALPKESGTAGIAVGPDGKLWFTNPYTSTFGKMTTSGTEIKEYNLPKESRPDGIVAGPDGNLWIVETQGNKIAKATTEGVISAEYALPSGSFPRSITVGHEGSLWFAAPGTSKVGKITTSGVITEYAQPSGSQPFGITADAEGNLWFTDYNTGKVGKLSLSSRVGSGGAHDTQTIYYSAIANAEHPGCGTHPEWANLPCIIQPAEQPGTSGLPNVPVTTFNAYNQLDEPEETTETVGSTTRTKTFTYTGSGWPLTSAVSSSVGTALPTVTDAYNAETGLLEKQSTTTEGKTKTITSKYNALGQLASYTDAGEKTTSYKYDENGRVKEVNDGKGTETYTYSTTTGLPSELLNEYGTTKLLFTGSYDAEGNVLSEGYPNGMEAKYVYNATGMSTGLEYKKTTHCTEEHEKCVWFKDAVVPSIHGQWLEQTSTLSHQAYTYDTAGRLTQVQNTPAGGTCTTRIYAYDADTNRTSFTTDEPNAKGECTSEGGTVAAHSYDSADRLTDSGVKYNEFGDITALPAADAGGKESSEELTSTYYTDNQVASETQNGQTIGYNLDPAWRTLETIATGKKVATTTLHYAGSGSTPAWTENTSGETSRDIPGLDGGLAAIQNGTEAPELQLTNLHGDIIAKAYLSETATELASKADTSEFGVPTTSLPSKYSWLGAGEIPTELPSGVVAMGARSYVPELGRFLQPDPIPGGSANAYAYTFGDPVNTSDLSGAYTAGTSLSGLEYDGYVAEVDAAEVRRANEEAAAQAAAERAAELARMIAEMAGPQYLWGEEWEEYEEEEYEYASYHHATKPESEEGQAEAAILVQPLNSEEGHGSQVVLNPLQLGEEAEGNERDEGVPHCTASSGRAPHTLDVSRRRRRREPKQCTPHEPNRHEHNPEARPAPPGATEPIPQSGQCPEGQYPGIGAFTGRPTCIGEGERAPDKEEKDPNDAN